MGSYRDIESKQRNSNIELFRILATLLVLIVHFNGWFVGGLPTSYEWSTFTLQEGAQLYIQGLSCCCVNCFLIISGWFGIKLKFRSIWKLWLVLIGVYVPCFFMNCILNHNFVVRNFIDSIVAFSRESYYIQNYLILLFISPVLNSFIEKNGKQITSYALAFWIIEFVMEYIFRNKCLYIEHGYSLFHFVTIYLLARTAFLNKDCLFRVKGRLYLVFYFVVALIIAFGRGIFASKAQYWTGYSCPLNVIESFCLFLSFAKLKFSSNVVNSIASTTLFVYVMQVSSPVIGFLKKIDVFLLCNFSYGCYLLSALSVIIVFFILVSIYAKMMEKFLNVIFSPLGKYLENKTLNFFIYE